MKAPASAPTVLDRLIGYVSPQMALDRLRARAQYEAVAAWSGSDRTRHGTRGWIPSRGSADADNIPQIDQMRKDSRDLIRNVPIATGAIGGVCTSVVGTGLSAQPSVDVDVLEWDDEQAQEWQDGTRRDWLVWAESTDCDITRHSDFYGLQGLAFRSALENGDVLALLPYQKREGSAYDLRVQLVEADRLSNPDMKGDTETLVAGVEKDAQGAPLKYWISDKHPGALTFAAGMKWSAVQAFGAKTGRRNALHIFDRKRIDQTRGVPYLAPVFEIIKQLGRYTDAEIMAAVTAGMFSVFVTSNGAGIQGPIPGVTEETGNTTNGEDVTMGYGSIVDLKPGETIDTANPGRPNPNFDPFFEACVRQIGIALELPFEVLIKHFTASYSAARAALIEAFKFYRGRRAWLVQQFCQPVYEAWLEEAVASGRIQAPGFFDDPALRRAYCACTWHGDAMPQIDPQKEVGAARDRVDAGFSDHERETMELTGEDYMTTHRRQVRIARLRREDGLVTPAPTNKAIEPPPKTDDSPDLETPTAPPKKEKAA